MRTLAVVLLCVTAAWAGEREITACEICGGDVYQTPKEYVSGNTKYIYMYDPPHKPYCTRCQRDINNGEIDPANPPALSPRDDEEMGVNPYGNEYMPRAGPPKKAEDHSEQHSGFGAWKWVLGMIVAGGFAIRYFLRS